MSRQSSLNLQRSSLSTKRKGISKRNYTDEELEKMYGIEAQRQALNSYREKKLIYEKQHFKNALKVKLDDNKSYKKNDIVEKTKTNDEYIK